MDEREALEAVRAKLKDHPLDYTKVADDADIWNCVAHNEGQTCCVDELHEALLVLVAMHES